MIIGTVKPKFSKKKSYPDVISSSTNSVWTTLGLNPGLCGEKHPTNSLYYDTGTGLLVIRPGCPINSLNLQNDDSGILSQHMKMLHSSVLNTFSFLIQFLHKCALHECV
jgi:hypothetical protein